MSDQEGISSGRMHSYYYRQMISLCSIDAEYSAPGSDLVVLWSGSTRLGAVLGILRLSPTGSSTSEALIKRSMPWSRVQVLWSGAIRPAVKWMFLRLSRMD